MRITCPSCEAAYEVPLDRLAPGRGVRCVKCGTVWQPVPELPEEPVAAAPAPEPPVAEAPAVLAEPVADEPPPVPEPPSRSGGKGLLAAWLLSAALLAGCGAAAVAYRGPIMQAWPPSTRAFAALGLAR